MGLVKHEGGEGRKSSWGVLGRSTDLVWDADLQIGKRLRGVQRNMWLLCVWVFLQLSREETLVHEPLVRGVKMDTKDQSREKEDNSGPF